MNHYAITLSAVPWIAGLLLVLLSAGCGHEQKAQLHDNPSPLKASPSLSSNELAGFEIAQMNLRCAEGLPGCERVDVPQALATLDQWAARVKAETKRHEYRFERSPAEFEHSRGFFKLLMLGVVLAEDYQVKYRPERQLNPQTARDGDGFFAEAPDVFLPGLLGAQRQGTCSSMPVLYVAVGRRLGYPLKLVTTKGHLFVRWEGEGERFNLEVTGEGLNRFADDYYRQWPFPISAAEEQAEGYLKSLTSNGELAVFWSIRAMCLRETGRWAEAAEAFAAAAKLAPEVRSYEAMAASCRAAAPVGASIMSGGTK
jgi:hypothetical protein